MMNDVFLSYSHKNADWMRKVRDSLQAAELTVWTDEGIEPGTPEWDKAIEDALTHSKAMIVILSPRAKESDNVRNEIHYARNNQVATFPLLVAGDEKTAVPLLLAGGQYIDLRKDYESGINRLIKSFRAYPTFQINPLILLWWLFFHPEQLVKYRVKFGKNAEKKPELGSWVL